MLHALLIAVFVGVYLRDGLREPILSDVRSLRPVSIAEMTLGTLFGTWAIAHWVIWMLGRRIDRTGSLRAVRRAEAILLASRVTAVAIHVFCILCLGWLDVVRSVTGNLIAVDELVACLPVVLVLCLGWWSMYPIDRRLREAVILSELDHGRGLPPMLTRWQFVLGALRHQLAWVLLPIACILVWVESLERARARGWLPEGALISTAVQILGPVLILILMPLALRRIWDTVTLGAGPLRDRLIAMCRAQRVRVRDLLVWRTHGVMINGAVMGLIPRLRYILLTDALIEHLPADQVEAVTAHEIGHVRRRHLLWLIASAMGSITLIAAVIQISLELWRPGLSQSILGQSVGSVLSLGAGLAIFGFVSRRFEWQADAFAVQHLSGHQPGRWGGGPPGIILTPQAVASMGGALEAVARLNHIPKHRFTWRHGSIATRQKRLLDLVGREADRLAIDRQARWLAVGSAVLGVLAAGLIAWAGVSSPPEGPRRAAAAQGTEVLGAIRQDARDRERLHLP